MDEFRYRSYLLRVFRPAEPSTDPRVVIEEVQSGRVTQLRPADGILVVSEIAQAMSRAAARDEIVSSPAGGGSSRQDR